MLPYCTVNRIDCGMTLGVKLFCGLKYCGHNGFDLELNILLWNVNIGIEFAK